MAINSPTNSQKNKKLVLIIGIPLVIGMGLFSQWYGEFNESLTTEYRFLTYAIGTGIIALFLHFFRDWKYVKNNLIILYLVSSLELLLLIMAPILSTFQIYMKEHSQEMLVLFTAGVLSWWIVTIIRTNNTSGKFAFAMSTQMYFGFIVMIGLFAWLVTLVNSTS
ncbi:hypothetical protein [Candidatus Nitrosopumilus sediminis]|uniref:Uncharacterized protein n=1 Tax=Candidatus Nitrosopumilus sediminis TaxID=1229909 RepID=K0BAW9_9ARCH|nr:hypothetical protein [Candidatus Nitrosopumilus sediminis]AFS82634.1 hypothetical protein NSED_04140 [Candidatus Nitrosopumilus sediminis]